MIFFDLSKTIVSLTIFKELSKSSILTPSLAVMIFLSTMFIELNFISKLFFFIIIVPSKASK